MVLKLPPPPPKKKTNKHTHHQKCLEPPVYGPTSHAPQFGHNIDPLHMTSQGACGGLHWKKEKFTEAAFDVCLQRMHASVFLMVAICWSTHSLLQDIALLAGVQVQ